MTSPVPPQIAAPVRWEPDRTTRAVPWPVPPLAVALARGARFRCPACGKGRLFAGYLRVCAECSHCHAPLGLVRADDAPPYFTILLAGHILVPTIFILERGWDPPMWLEAAVVLPFAALFTLALLRPVKGATVGAMLTLGLFKSDPDA